jgi:hypothetical protein
MKSQGIIYGSTIQLDYRSLGYNAVGRITVNAELNHQDEAAKNFENVVVVVKPSRYTQVIGEYKKNGDVSIETRKALAIEAFKETSRYDSVIREFLEKT